MKRVTIHDVINQFRGSLHLDKAIDNGRQFQLEMSAHGKRVHITMRRDGVLYSNVNGSAAVVSRNPGELKRNVMEALRHG